MIKQLFAAFKVTVYFSLLIGLYGFFITAVSSLVFHQQATGSLVSYQGKVVGSELIAQDFKDERYFYVRPSASKFNTLPSAASNYSQTSKELQDIVKKRIDDGFENEMLYSSASGLDPHISINSALNQIPRIIKNRPNLSSDVLVKLIQDNTKNRDLLILGKERVNVLNLNIGLDLLDSSSAQKN